MKRNYFLMAALLSGLIHLATLGGLLGAAIWPRFTPPELVEGYGDSDRPGLDVSAIGIDPGSYRPGDANTPGGDDLPETVAKPEEPTDNPPASVEAGGVETLPAPVASPVEKPMPQSIPDLPEETPAADKPTPEPAAPPKTETPSPSRRPVASPGATASPSLPGKSGGARLGPGTPSRGGTIGSRSGVRMPAGYRLPVYPAAAQQAGIEGTPEVWLRISAEGKVLDARIHKSSGYAILDASALRWARAQRYLPARLGGKPVEAEAVKPVRFRLY